MKVYGELTKQVYLLPCTIEGKRYNIPKPSKGVFEYIIPNVLESQTLGDIIIIDGIATHTVLEINNWLNINCSIELEITRELLESDYSGFILIAITRDIKFEYIDDSIRKAYLNKIDVTELACSLIDGIIIPTDTRLKIRQFPNIDFILEDGIIKEDKKDE